MIMSVYTYCNGRGALPAWGGDYDFICRYCDFRGQREPAMKFRRKPVIVEAEQYNGSFNHHEIPVGVCRWVRPGCPEAPHVHTAHNQAVLVVEGDWIIAEPDGRGYYPCKPDIFEAIYEKV